MARPICSAPSHCQQPSQPLSLGLSQRLLRYSIRTAQTAQYHSQLLNSIKVAGRVAQTCTRTYIYLSATADLLYNTRARRRLRKCHDRRISPSSPRLRHQPAKYPHWFPAFIVVSGSFFSTELDFGGIELYMYIHAYSDDTKQLNRTIFGERAIYCECWKLGSALFILYMLHVCFYLQLYADWLV